MGSRWGSGGSSVGQQRILAISIGTPSVRALLLDLQGKLDHKRTFLPRPDVRDVYEGRYRRVYRQMYRRLRPLYEGMRRLTGYPPL